MKVLQKKSNLILFGALVLSSTIYAQNGQLSIQQDKKIDELIALKKEINTSENALDRYKIQIFSGGRKSAEKANSTFKEKLPNWASRMEYETPNYKIWVGSFRTRLEADKALIKIQKEFPTAFIFKPKVKE
ncbi:SPOR domain-containing protein [Mangrovimonas cancribranchiae]|uniref:SPOR domain-containing protein n=1 Tax=Mangrovimonas cancribranchiae TaxID=3080055 RepID=A0AAU6P5P7_9FLAO